MNTAADTKTEQRMMRRAFALVSPEKRGSSWKDPIGTLVVPDALEAAGVSLDDIRKAVPFFTATDARIEAVHNGDRVIGMTENMRVQARAGERGELIGYVVTAPGYRAGPAW